jgi:hypothetical protein
MIKVCLPTDIVLDLKLSDGAKILYLVVMATSEGKPSVTITRAKIAKLIGKSQRTVSRLVAELKESGYVKVNGGFEQINEYCFTELLGSYIEDDSKKVVTTRFEGEVKPLPKMSPVPNMSPVEPLSKMSPVTNMALNSNTNNKEELIEIKKEIKNKDKDKSKDKTDASHQASTPETKLTELRKISSHNERSAKMIASAKRGEIEWKDLTATEYAVYYANYQKKKATNPKGKTGYNYKYDGSNMKTFLEAHNLPPQHILTILEGIVDEWLASPTGSQLGYISTYMLSRGGKDIDDTVKTVKDRIIPQERKYTSNDFLNPDQKPQRKIMEGLTF